MTDHKRAVKLIMVTPDNNNKYYDMYDLGDGTFKAVWGRVDVTEQSKIYDIYEWDKIYHSKVKKGYKDVTHLHADKPTGSNGLNILSSDKHVQELITTLQGYANQTVKANYTVSAKGVTQAQVDEAQRIVDSLVSVVNIGSTSVLVNELLIELFHIIPRKMKKVQEELIENDLRSQYDLDNLNKIIDREQDLLDVMRGQVQAYASQGDDDSADLSKFGLTISLVTEDRDLSLIKKMLGPNSRQFRKAYRVVNGTTQETFNAFLKKARIKMVKPYWHGSRNENWWSIINNGLLIRPAGAIKTGAMFGNGIYFADKAQKSIGYCSTYGSYWAGGRDNRGYLALYDVHVGRWLHVKNHQSWMYNLNERNLKSRGDYDSLFAEGGYDLRNNEYIVYRPDQCTIKYVVEISS